MLDRLERMKRIAQDRSLLIHIERPAESIAHREIHEHGSRRFDPRREVAPCRHDYSGDARGFNHSRDQTNGLVVKGSGGNQHERVDTFIAQFARKRRRRFVHHCRADVNASHESAVMMRSDLANLARRR